MSNSKLIKNVAAQAGKGDPRQSKAEPARSHDGRAGYSAEQRGLVIDALLARHLMLVAMDAETEGDHQLAEHLLDVSLVVYDRQLA